MKHANSHSPATIPRLRPVGSRAWIVDLPTLDTVLAWHHALTTNPLPDQVEVIASAQSILVRFATRSATIRAKEHLEKFSPAKREGTAGRRVGIGVVYDGEDLHRAAEHMGISAEALVARHTEQRWLAAFGGFAPGFVYCVPAENCGYAWDVPRLDSPRTEVPAGAVALAGNFSAVYPRSSPGGWQLVGHTSDVIWDPHAETPALLQPGDVVEYRAVKESVTLAGQAAGQAAGAGWEPECRSGSAGRAQGQAGARDGAAVDAVSTHGSTAARPALKVLDAGMQSTFQDLGRRGLGDMGVTASGVADRASAWVANDVLGNASEATVIENIGGLSLVALAECAVCLTGADADVEVEPDAAAEARAAGRGSAATRRVELAQPILLRAGSTLRVTPRAGEKAAGLRTYVAVRDGFAAERVLGSSATDSLSGLGPAPLEAGQELRIGRRTVATSVGSGSRNPVTVWAGAAELRCVLGPRENWFGSEEVSRFCELEWEVTQQSNRVGLRLGLPAGEEPLRRSRAGEVTSEGMVRGSVQVPPNGEPVVFLADHPVTGGYPVIATVIDEDVDVAAQLRPRQRVRFVAVDPGSLEPVMPKKDGGRDASTV